MAFELDAPVYAAMPITDEMTLPHHLRRILGYARRPQHAGRRREMSSHAMMAIRAASTRPPLISALPTPRHLMRKASRLMIAALLRAATSAARRRSTPRLMAL